MRLGRREFTAGAIVSMGLAALVLLPQRRPQLTPEQRMMRVLRAEVEAGMALVSWPLVMRARDYEGHRVPIGGVVRQPGETIKSVRERLWGDRYGELFGQ